MERHKAATEIVNTHMNKIKIISTIFIFIVAITTGRLVWLEAFQSSTQPFVSQGVLDLRQEDVLSERTITLDGEWEFYPGTWIFSDDTKQEHSLDTVHYAQVPGNWSKLLQPEQPSPFGYGSYRMRILLHPEDTNTYSIHVPSVRTASQLFANGRLIGFSGKPAPKTEGYKARNVPYTVTFAADRQSSIEIVLQAANFSDPRGGGLIRSLKFGSEEAIHREVQISTAMQMLIAAAMLIQAIYLLIIFVINRNKLWFHFSLVLLSSTAIVLNSNEDKLLLHWFPITYEWTFKILNLALATLAYASLQCLSGQLPRAWRSKILLAYGIISIAAVCLTILLPIQYQISLQIGILILVLPSLIVAISYIFRMALRGTTSSLLLILTYLAFANHFAWWYIHLISGVKVIYYPFDLLAGLITVTSIGVNRYFEMYAEQKELTEKLKEMNLKKDEFLANTSHELRNPLHGMINISQVVLEREQHTIQNQSVKQLETVVSVGRRMSLMLDDMLDVVRLKDNQIHLRLQGIAIQPIVNGVFDMIRFMTDGKLVALLNEVPKNFPTVLADENRLIQIIFNLAHNAVKFTSEGEVVIHAYVEKGLAYIVVADTGMGMEEATIQRIFEPYEQAFGNSGIEGGFGLGLSICKKLVELHGGTIQAQSVPGQGSQFTFTLPLFHADAIHDVNQAIATPSTQEVAASIALPSESREEELGHFQVFSEDKPRILVVDDDAVNLRIIESILADQKYHIVAVTNAMEALALIDSGEWDLIISDVMMPHLSGYELTRRIRERYPQISELPVLLLTARSQPEDIESGFLAGANDYVTKPVDGRELRSRVLALTQLKKSMRERIRMEAAWLQAQIEPHFFFNTLNSIVALHDTDSDLMLKLIEQFGFFLREKFKFQNAGELVPLEDELTLVQSYLFIEKTRFGERLQVQWEMEDPKHMEIPPYTIQPLVENAVAHGLMKRSQGGMITIRITHHKDYTEVSVADNGVGMKDPHPLKETGDHSSCGIGLRNVDLRLKRLYGKGLHIESKPGVGTTVSFEVRSKHGLDEG